MRKLLFILMALIGVSFGSYAQERTITGVVLSGDDNEPIVGASVMVTGTTLGTTTDIDGRFTINNVPSSAKTVKGLCNELYGY